MSNTKIVIEGSVEQIDSILFESRKQLQHLDWLVKELQEDLDGFRVRHADLEGQLFHM